ncbi:MAG TPA: hypothetical protein VM198_09285 [Longimicrobiales bacterium]|nr:hypothetical protein [Longimicrobiales bacterium]
MMEKPTVGSSLWVYGYEMIPPHREQGMTVIRGLINRKNGEAKREDRTWTARLVTEQQVTHVMIVSDSPELDLEANRAVEAELRTLGVDFLATIPMLVGDGAEPV